MAWEKPSGGGGGSVVQQSSKWQGKTWNVIGDSLTDANSWASIKYHQVISSEKEMVTNVHGFNGLGFTQLTPGANAIPDKVANTETNADLITIFAGENDVRPIVNGTRALGKFGDTGRDTYYGSLDYTFSQLVKRFPTKTIGAISQTKHGKGDEATIRKMVVALKEVCGSYGIPVLDLFNSGNVYAYNATFRADMMTDGIHFNNKGNKMLADKIGSFIESI